jgi:hypothetical protein
MGRRRTRQLRVRVLLSLSLSLSLSRNVFSPSLCDLSLCTLPTGTIRLTRGGFFAHKYPNGDRYVCQNHGHRHDSGTYTFSHDGKYITALFQGDLCYRDSVTAYEANGKEITVQNDNLKNRGGFMFIDFGDDKGDRCVLGAGDAMHAEKACIEADLEKASALDVAEVEDAMARDAACEDSGRFPPVSLSLPPVSLSLSLSLFLSRLYVPAFAYLFYALYRFSSSVCRAFVICLIFVFSLSSCGGTGGRRSAQCRRWGGREHKSARA